MRQRPVTSDYRPLSQTSFKDRSGVKQDAQHPAQGLGRAPQKLVANGEAANVLGTHGELADAPYGDAQGAGHGHRRQVLHRGFARVGYDFDPGVVIADELFDVGQWNVLLQLESQGLAMATHRAHAHAKAVDRRCRRPKARTLAQDLVGFRPGLPLFAADAVAQVLVDPGNEGAAQRYAEIRRLLGRQRLLASQYLAVDFENRGLR